jgi:hypothetical protein
LSAFETGVASPGYRVQLYWYHNPWQTICLLVRNDILSVVKLKGVLRTRCGWQAQPANENHLIPRDRRTPARQHEKGTESK